MSTLKDKENTMKRKAVKQDGENMKKKRATDSARRTVSYSFELNKATKTQVKQREEDLRTFSERADSSNDASAADTVRLGDSVFLGHVKREALAREKIEKYPTGKGKGTSYNFNYKDVGFSVRLDKSGEKFYPRVSVTGYKDKRTVELGDMLNGKPAWYKEAFMKGLRGEERDKTPVNAKNKAYQAAFNDGLEARVTTLISDVLDYPGSSVITEKLLNNATEDTYKQLFVGDKREGSYGAIPSQNQNPKHENSAERIKAYQNMGQFVSDGTLSTSFAQSNLPTLRKFNSFIPLINTAEIGTVIIKKSVGNSEAVEISSENFNDQIKAQAIVDRHQRFEKDNPNFEIFSDPEDSEDEREKYEVLDEEQLQELAQKLAAKKAKIMRKELIIQQLLANKRFDHVTSAVVTVVTTADISNETRKVTGMDQWGDFVMNSNNADTLIPSVHGNIHHDEDDEIIEDDSQIVNSTVVTNTATMKPTSWISESIGSQQQVSSNNAITDNLDRDSDAIMIVK